MNIFITYSILFGEQKRLESLWFNRKGRTSFLSSMKISKGLSGDRDNENKMKKMRVTRKRKHLCTANKMNVTYLPCNELDADAAAVAC